MLARPLIVLHPPREPRNQGFGRNRSRSSQEIAWDTLLQCSHQEIDLAALVSAQVSENALAPPRVIGDGRAESRDNLVEPRPRLGAHRHDPIVPQYDSAQRNSQIRGPAQPYGVGNECHRESHADEVVVASTYPAQITQECANVHSLWFVERVCYQMILAEMSSYEIDYNADFGM
jgi:hypothetical protein